MFETHVVLIVALTAAVIAIRRQPRLPTFRLEWDNISAGTVSAKRFVVESDIERKRMELYIDEKGQPIIEFPADIIDGERWQMSVRSGHGLGGFRVEFMLSSPHEPPHQLLAVAFGASPSSSAQVSIFDANDGLLAKLP